MLINLYSNVSLTTHWILLLFTILSSVVLFSCRPRSLNERLSYQSNNFYLWHHGKSSLVRWQDSYQIVYLQKIPISSYCNLLVIAHRTSVYITIFLCFQSYVWLSTIIIIREADVLTFSHKTSGRLGTTLTI